MKQLFFIVVVTSLLYSNGDEMTITLDKNEILEKNKEIAPLAPKSQDFTPLNKYILVEKDYKDAVKTLQNPLKRENEK